MTEPTKVSIIIPVKPGGHVACLDAIRHADYPTDSFEVIVVEGTQPSRQRNVAANSSGGEILYFLDDDATVLPEFLLRAVSRFQDPEVSVVGGPSLTPVGDSTMQQAFAMAFASPFGGGGMRNRYRRSGPIRRTCDRELILCNLAFRRETFLAHGGFDERLYPNEENELLERIKKSGGILLHDPDLFVTRSQRPTLKAFCRQLFSYGRGRGEQTVLSAAVKPATLVPSLFLVYLLLLPMANMPVYYLPLLCYLVLICLFTMLEVVRSRKVLAAAALPMVFPLFHLSYGAGLIRGLSNLKGPSAESGGIGVSVRWIKRFEGEWTRT